MQLRILKLLITRSYWPLNFQTQKWSISYDICSKFQKTPSGRSGGVMRPNVTSAAANAWKWQGWKVVVMLQGDSSAELPVWVTGCNLLQMIPRSRNRVGPLCQHETAFVVLLFWKAQSLGQHTEEPPKAQDTFFFPSWLLIFTTDAQIYIKNFYQRPVHFTDMY